MVLGFYGRQGDGRLLRQEIIPDGTRASALLLRDAAQRYGLSARGLSVSASQIQLVNTPAILHWRGEHFVVLELATARYVQIIDPAFGRRVVTRAHFARAFSGTALTFEPGPSFSRRPADHPVNASPRSVSAAARAAFFSAVTTLSDVALVLLGVTLLRDQRAGTFDPEGSFFGLTTLFILRASMVLARDKLSSAVPSETTELTRLNQWRAETVDSPPAHCVSVVLYLASAAVCDPLAALVMFILGLLQAVGEYLHGEALEIRENGVRAARAQYMSYAAAQRQGMVKSGYASQRRLDQLRERWLASHRFVRRRDSLAAVFVRPLFWVAPVVFLTIYIYSFDEVPFERVAFSALLYPLMLRAVRAGVQCRPRKTLFLSPNTQNRPSRNT